MDLQTIQTLFPLITDAALLKLQTFHQLILEINQHLNLVSRKDTESLVERHFLPSLAISKLISFKPGTSVMDVGTGGGFPGIPLAIIFPEVHFLLVDSTQKKIKALQTIVSQLELKNVSFKAERVEAISQKFDFVIGRAVADLPTFCAWTQKNVAPHSKNTLANGILYLKGGAFADELKKLPRHLVPKLYPLDTLLSGPYCADKVLVHIAVRP